MDETLREFLYTWEKRKSGDLPAVDFKVSCSKCGSEILGDTLVAYSADGLVCTLCLDKIKASKRGE